MVAYYRPRPKQRQKCLPKCIPRTVVPSGLGDQGIVGNWLFYYLKGGDHLHDFSPKDNHGAIKGASWKDGRYGWGLKFDGVDDYVEVPDSASLDIPDEITMTAWIKMTATDQNWNLAMKCGAYFLIEADLGDASVPYCGLHIGGAWQRFDFGHDAGWFKGEFHHVAMTYDGSNVRTYIDGDLDQTYSQTGKIGTSDYFLGIGTNSYVRDRWFEGYIPIFRIYNTAKNGSWILRRFERTKGIFGL